VVEAEGVQTNNREKNNFQSIHSFNSAEQDTMH
jgi:hypothetical protein